MSYRDFDPQQAQDALSTEEGLRVLDVRTEPEHASYHIEGSALLPVQEIVERVGELDRNAEYLVYCEHGVRSLAACEFLAEQGFSGLTNLRGGMAAWVGAGLPYVQPKR